MLMRAARRAPSLIHEGHEGPRSADNPPLPFKGGPNTRARGASSPAPRAEGSGRVQRCSCVLPAARLLSSTKDTKVHEAPTIPRCPLRADRTPARAAQAPLLRAAGGSGRVQRCSCVLPAARLLSSTKDTKVHEAPTIPRCPLRADRTPARIPARLPGDGPARGASSPAPAAEGCD
jgi:hypothetical protein